MFLVYKRVKSLDINIAELINLLKNTLDVNVTLGSKADREDLPLNTSYIFAEFQNSLPM